MWQVLLIFYFCLRLWHGSAGHFVLNPKKLKTEILPGIGQAWGQMFPYLPWFTSPLWRIPAVLRCLFATVARICTLSPALSAKSQEEVLKDYCLWKYDFWTSSQECLQIFHYWHMPICMFIITVEGLQI